MTTKDAVIAQLKNQSDYVSGETLGKTLGISRAAVNSAIRSLRDDGYEILSSTNRGYSISRSPDRINCGELSAFLPPERVESVLCLDSVDSTNNALRSMAIDGAKAGQIIIAESQTAGRGRYGRQFVSPKGKGIYISALLRPDSVEPQTATFLTAWVAVAICNAVEKVCGVRPAIKWVNDLLLGGKKICGILTEMSVESESGHIQYIIVGAGLNVNETAEDFPEELREKATSLFENTGRGFSRAQIAAEIVKELDIMAASFPADKEKYLRAYRKDCVTTGKTVRVFGKEERHGFAKEINDDFALVVKFDDGEEKAVSSGEVTVRSENGYV